MSTTTTLALLVLVLNLCPLTLMDLSRHFHLSEPQSLDKLHKHTESRASSARLQTLRCTWCGFLQRVPAVEGPLLLLAQVGAVLQQPMGDPALADAWKGARHQITKRAFFIELLEQFTNYRQALEVFKRDRREYKREEVFFSLPPSLWICDHTSLSQAAATETLPGSSLLGWEGN